MYITPPYTVVHPTANCPAVMGANLASLTIAHEGRRGVVCNTVEKLFAHAEPDYYNFFSLSFSSIFILLLVLHLHNLLVLLVLPALFFLVLLLVLLSPHPPKYTRFLLIH